MILTLHGTGAGDPNPDRLASALSARFGDGSLFLFDAGEACARAMRRDGVDLNRVAGVAVSHMHADHWCGLPALWTAWSHDGRSEPVDIYVPRGTIEFFRTVQLNALAFPEKLPYRIEYHEIAPIDLPDGWRVELIPTTHLAGVREYVHRHGVNGEAYGYLLRSGERRIVLSQDCGDVEDLRGVIDDAELLVCESTHLRPRDVLEMACASGVRRVIFTHVPRSGGSFPGTFDGIRWGVAVEGERIDLDR
jgi:ribonuclease Z